MNHQSVAIDGPAGAGKSTLARRLAGALGFLYVDTGAIYRTVGLAALRGGVAPDDRERVPALLPGLRIEMRHGADGVQSMLLDGEDVSEAIRRHEISAYASGVSAIPAVRAFLLDRQRELAQTHSVVMDGRDIGTVVLPGADVKIFLTADPADRAMRRYQELKDKGQEADYDTVYQDLLERDRQDSSRAAAPLRQAEDALLVDTTGLTVEESFTRLLDTVRGRLGV